MTVPVYIEGKKYIVEESKNILEICLSFGFNIPYFCWHPALGSVGSCRQCAIQCTYDDVDTKSGKLVMACMTPVVKNINISLFNESIVKFRKGIIELLMINHPHDCPVCEEGGNCHLQDMTVMAGHVYRRYKFPKRTHCNQFLGPFIAHEMNRCITCYRCVRFYKNYAGGEDLGVFGIHDNIYFGRVRHGRLQNEFSGNLIEICPTGVFTDKTKSTNYTRKWDTIFAPSICHQCSIGCNIIVGERYGKLCRVENRYNSNINGYFLCDRGRFGCDYIDLNDRPKNPLQKKSNHCFTKIDADFAIELAASVLKRSHKIIGIGSSRASIESNFALRRLVGPDNFFTGIHRSEQERLLLIFEILNKGDIYVPSLREIENYDVILILGEDITQTGARAALSVRQSVRRKAYETAAQSQGIFDWQFEAVNNITQNIKCPLFITSLDKTKLDDLAEFTYCDSVQNQARFGFAIAHMIDNRAPFVDDFNDEVNDKLTIVTQALIQARKPLIISGTNSGSKELIGAAINIAQALKNRSSDVGITFIVNDVNSMGVSMIDNKSLDDALILLSNNNYITSFISVVILENDLYYFSDANSINRALKNVNYLIVLDHQKSLIQSKADLILPSTSFIESNGTVINYECRAQRFFRLYDPIYYNDTVCILESWRWLYLINDLYMDKIRTEKLKIDNVIDDLVKCFPELIKIKDAAPDANFRVHGQKIAQAPYRYSGRTSMFSHIDIHESSVYANDETMFTNSMEGSYSSRSRHKHIPFVWSPGWNSPQAWNKFQNKVNESLYPSDPGVLLLHKESSIQINYISKIKWFTSVSSDVEERKDKEYWIIAPYWYLLGSEYTSQRSKYVKKCMFDVHAILNPLDVSRLNIKEGMMIQFKCAGEILCLPVQSSINLPIFHIGLPMGFPGIPIFFANINAQSVEGVLSVDGKCN